VSDLREERRKNESEKEQEGKKHEKETHTGGIGGVLRSLVEVVAVDGGTGSGVNLRKAPPSSVHQHISSERVVTLLLKSTRKDRVALVVGRAERGVVRVELEES
jgi:hypothetical protein